MLNKQARCSTGVYLKKANFFPFLFFLLLLYCGYSPRSLLPPHLKTVAIASVENSSTQPGLGDELTKVLPQAFNSDRTLRLTSIEQADLSLSINITGYSRSALAYDVNQEISTYEVIITAQVEALDQVRNEPLFTGAISSKVTYNPSNSSEEQAIQAAVGKLVREIIRQVITAW